MQRLAILGSTRGTNLVALYEAQQAGLLHGRIEIVMGHKAEAYILERASAYGIKTLVIPVNGLSREAHDTLLVTALMDAAIDLVVLIGYMRILSPCFIRAFKGKIINVHPSLLPAFAGKMDLEVHAAVIAAGETESGCSVHIVTEEVDGGPVIVQKRCQVWADDTPLTLRQRVQALEGPALVEAINQMLRSNESK